MTQFLRFAARASRLSRGLKLPAIVGGVSVSVGAYAHYGHHKVLFAHEQQSSPPPAIIPQETTSALSTEKKQKPSKKQLLMFILRNMKDDWLLFLLAAIGAIGAGAMGVWVPRSIGVVMDYIRTGQYSLIIEALRSLLYAIVGRSAFGMVAAVCLCTALARLERRLQTQVYRAILAQPASFFDSHTPTGLVGTLKGDVNEICHMVRSSVLQGIQATASVGIGVVSLYMTSPHLSLVLGIGLPLMFAVGNVAWRLVRKYSSFSKNLSDAAYVQAGDVLQSIRTVQSYAAESMELERFSKLLMEAETHTLYSSMALSCFGSLVSLAYNTVTAVMLYLGAQCVKDETMTAGSITSFLGQVQRVEFALGRLSLLSSGFVKSLVAAEKVTEVLSALDDDATTRTHGATETRSDEKIEGSVKFSDVHFHYPTRVNKAALSGVDIEFQAGKTTAVVGDSGAGKSTLVALLQKFYTPDKGDITIGGRSLESIPTKALRRNVATVEQSPAIFAATLADNIRYAHPEASMEQVVAAAKLANVDEFAEGLPQHYDTMVGGGHTQLSQGQKQRVAIARAFLKGSKIVVFDEATSALDGQNEVLVCSAMKQLAVGRAMVIITHKYSTVANADHVIVMRNGKVAEQGTFSSLSRDKHSRLNYIMAQDV